ncbi:MAG: PIG-L deacetylase family protein [Planctomycetota bacterium]
MFARLKDLRAFPPLLSIAALPRGRIGVVAPHPDDEVIGAGGAIALHAGRGDRVSVIVMTDGAAGDPESHARGQIVEVRRRESQAAGAVLGVASHEFVGRQDGTLAPDAATVAALAQLLARERCDLVYAPSPFECHPDHVATAMIAAAACQSLTAPPRLHLFEVNQQHLPSYLLDITPVLSQKAAALRCFRSQMAYVDIVAKTFGHNVGRAVNVSDASVTHIEGYLIAPSDFAGFLEQLAQLLERVPKP